METIACSSGDRWGGMARSSGEGGEGESLIAFFSGEGWGRMARSSSGG